MICINFTISIISRSNSKSARYMYMLNTERLSTVIKKFVISGGILLLCLHGYSFIRLCISNKSLLFAQLEKTLELIQNIEICTTDVFCALR